MASALTTIELDGLSYWNDTSKTTLQAQVKNTADTVLTLNSANGTNNACSVTNASSLGMVDTDAGAGTFTMKPAAVTTTYEVTWPSAVAAGNGYVLKSTTGGVLSWGQDSDNEWKQPVRVATTENLAGLVGLLTIDDVTVAAGDRVLVKNQTTATQNGIWVASGAGWSRAADMLAAAPNSYTYGFSVIATEGTVNANRGWVQSTYQGDVGVDNLVFLDLVSAAGTVNEIQINDPDNEKGFATSSTLLDPLTGNPSQTTFTYAISADGTIGKLGVGMTPTAANAGAFLLEGNSAAAGSALVGTSIGISGGDGDGIASGGIVEIFGGNASAGTGGTVELVLGESTGNNGGDFIVSGGNGGTAGTGNGGNMTVGTGNGGTAGGNGGNITMETGTPASPGVGNSGNISITTGNTGISTGNSGTISLLTGSGSSGGVGNITLETGGTSSTSPAGNISLTCGGGSGGAGGVVSLVSGDTSGAGVGGNVNIASGTSLGTATGNAGNIVIAAGPSIATSTGNAGNVTMLAGTSITSGDGGNITLGAGTSSGGTFGEFVMRAGTNVATNDGFKFQNSGSVDLVLIRGASENATTNVAGAGQGTFHVTGGGSFTQDVYGQTFNAMSDIRLKTNIVPIDNALEKLREIEGYSYNWKDNLDGKKQLGVIAQQLEEIGLSDIVTGTDENKAVNYLALIPLLIEAVKELSNEVKSRDF